MVRRMLPLGPLVLGLAAVLGSVHPVRARADAVINVTDFQYQPPDVTINPGESVTWSLKKGFHTTTSGLDSSDPNAGALWDEFIFSGQPSFTRAFPTPGVYRFFCRFHESLNMKGSVTVLGPTAAAATTWGAVKSLYK